jgi:hypothetical protein
MAVSENGFPLYFSWVHLSLRQTTFLILGFYFRNFVKYLDLDLEKIAPEIARLGVSNHFFLKPLKKTFLLETTKKLSMLKGHSIDFSTPLCYTV